jgi:hypothetical protein
LPPVRIVAPCHDRDSCQRVSVPVRCLRLYRFGLWCL